ncbi:MAG: DUF3048 domain-containing protein [Candidatus Falkowbacteria bacterium]|nr:DUF3048 domain-containing protein [Candidatus Falkowbacteria bacterium]
MPFLHNKKSFRLVLSASLIVVFFCGIGFYYYQIKNSKKQIADSNNSILDQKDVVEEVKVKEEDLKVACKDCVRRRSDGVLVPPGQENLAPIAIMIDNSVDARPANGLNKANIVYEVEAEGGITRYLAIYASNDNVDKIGPVRSVRPYFIDIAKEYGAIMTHCGGSPQALTKILKEGVLDINEFYKGEYFWRERSRQAPHNVYTSTNNIKDYLNQKKLKAPDFLSWKFKDEKPIEVIHSPSIKINYLKPVYSVLWKYDSLKNEYVRYLGGEIHDDEIGMPITAKNVIIMSVKISQVDDEGRIAANLSGTGKIIVCLDGQCKEGQWKKTTNIQRTKFYINDEEVELNAGKTWINIVRPQYLVEF